MGVSVRGVSLVVFAAAVLWEPGQAAAQVVAECDEDGNGVVDGFDAATYNEGQQYSNLLNFYAVTMASSPLHSPAPLEPFRLNVSLELNYVPQLSCIERSVFGGTKTENTNKTFVFPRPRVTVGLPWGLYAGVSGLPPVPAFGVRTFTISGELGYGRVIAQRFEVGGRLTYLYGKVSGDLAGPFGYTEDDPEYAQHAVDDLYETSLFTGEVTGGYRVLEGGTALIPYIGVGFSRVGGGTHMFVGEDEVDVPGENQEIKDRLYTGPHFELGVHVRDDRLELAAEAFMVPLNLDEGNPRFFFSPRVRVGYTFF